MQPAQPIAWLSNLLVSWLAALQGREKDYIILSCVRSNEHQVSLPHSDPGCQRCRPPPLAACPLAK